jgi:hypothetical protein
MRDPAIIRRTLKSVIDTLNDHHQEITLAAATLNASLLTAEGKGLPSFYINEVARKSDKLAFLLGAHTARCERTEAEVKHLRKSLSK